MWWRSTAPANSRTRSRSSTWIRSPRTTAGWLAGWTRRRSGDEFHHFGWNACSSALMHEGHDMSGLARRFLLVPGIRSSNIYVFDTAADPEQPTLHKTIEAADLAGKAGYSRPHTLHCGPDGVFMTCLGAGGGRRRPGRHRAAGPQHLRCASAPGRGNAGRSTSPTTPGGTCSRTP